MDKYLQYDHLELSEDPSFIRWAKGSQARDEIDWDGWLDTHPDKARMVSDAKSIVRAMKFVDDSPAPETENKVWNKIASDITTDKDTIGDLKNNRSRIFRLLPYVAVAAVALILLIMNIGNGFDTSVQTPFAKIENIALPDGSKVKLNADSKIQYDTKSWDKNRVVYMEGEAFFSVEKGSKFTVRTQNGSVLVLGTSFNVYNRNDQLKVHCETGRVSVKSVGKETILTPKQTVSVINREHTFTIDVADSDSRSTWKKGIFVYKSDHLSDVVSELERQFDIKISLDKAFRKMKYTGSFNKSNLNTALIEVFYPLDLKYEIEGKKVIITK